MKKLSLLVILALIVSVMTACTGTPVIYTTNCTCATCENSAGGKETETAPEIVLEGDLKTGVAIVANAKDSKQGEAKFDVTIAAVTVDAKGVIASCVIDSVGTSIVFDENGHITTDANTGIYTKYELKENYGMKKVTGKYEWYEQADALSKYVIGKTIEEVKNGAVNESGKAKDADLASVATIYIGGYVGAVEKAVLNAMNLGAKAGDELRLSVVPAFASLSDASDEKSGNAELDVDVCALTVKDGAITSCAIDSVQAKVAFDAQGQIVSGNEGTILTKNELKENYNMKAWGQAKYEWYEQAAAFAGYVKGKTFEEVASIAVNESAKPTDADLASSVTISIGGFKTLIQKAAK